MSKAFTAGERIWEFDTNRRVYPPKQKGESFSKGGPIYAEHFLPYTVKVVEPRSYIIVGEQSVTRRIGKAKAHNQFSTDQEREDNIWVNDKRYRLIRFIERLPASQLRAVADLVGWKDMEQ